jgi:TonB-linked SusC/RagA family outer membrane protein
MRKIVALFWVFVMVNMVAFAQTKTISGKIKDEKDGSALAGVSILVKGTSIGTTTKADGTFTLNAPADAKTLVISSLNFESKEVSIGKGVVNVSLSSSEAASLKDVVVTVPYGTVKKSTFTGSAGTVTASTIQKQQVTSVTRVLDGLIAGVSSTNGGGAPGSAPDIRIRGFGSVNASSAPLYVLNGVPYDGSIAALSNDEIESVDVLKDAAATNLYGSRAANGVIMITTKKGKKGPASIQLSVRHGISSRGIPEYDRVSIPEYYELTWEAMKNNYFYTGQATLEESKMLATNLLTGSENGLGYNTYNVPGDQLINPNTGKINPAAQLLWNDSWEEAVIQDAGRTNINLNISGGGDRSTYFISGGYLKENGFAKYSGYERFNFRTDVTTQANDWLKAGIGFDGASDKRTGFGTGALTNPFSYTRTIGPVFPVYQKDLTTGATILDENGNPKLDWGGGEYGPGTKMSDRPLRWKASNLLGVLQLDENRQFRINANFNAFAEASFLKNFTFKTTIGLNYLSADVLSYQNNQFGDAFIVKGRATQTNSYNTSLTANQVLSWNKSYKKHNVRALAGHENYQFKNRYLSAEKTGFDYPGTQQSLDNAKLVVGSPSSGEDIHRIESYFGSVNYSFDNKYLVSASLRTDGSSRFAQNVRWGQFYSFGLAWRLKQEKFMESINWVDDLKLKASYGEAGNDNIGGEYYQYIGYYYANGFGQFNVPNRIPNVDLKWEGNKSLNYGVEFALFKRRLTGSIELFSRVSNNLLFDVPVSPSSGFSSFFQNVGESKNYGVELQLGVNAVQKKNFDWRVDFNITHFKNVITRLPKDQRVKGIIQGSKKLMEGKSIYDFWLREYAGVDPATGLALYYRDVVDNKGNPTGERTLTNDINLASFYYVGATAIPDFSGGLTNSFRYKSFQLSILTTYSYGGHFYDGNYQSLMHEGDLGTHWHKDILNRWQKPGDITNVPRLQQNLGQAGASSRFLFDASYINIKNITISYDFSSILSKKTFIKDAQFFASMDNALIFTSKSGGDPQRSFEGVSSSTGYPVFRTITLGTTIKL